MSKILITGGTGSLGRALIAKWKDTHDLTILSRNPHRQAEVRDRFGLDPSQFVLTDICDYEAVLNACIGQDILIHAAALKVVSQGEQFPDEYHRVNVVGSQVVARAWMDAIWTTRHKNGDLIPAALEPRIALYINSDKAVQPINTYGLTKAMGEKIFIKSGFSSLRYGNVVASEGSFIHRWKALLEKGKPIPVRYPPPTRFFLTFAQALDLVDQSLNAINRGFSGVFVPDNLKSFSILEVAQALTNEVNICQSENLEPGEKQHEILVGEGEVPRHIGGGLCQVVPGWENYDNFPYWSKTARRMSGAEVLAALGVSRQQEIFA